MKIAVYSDLHLECQIVDGRTVPTWSMPEADVLVFAGDIINAKKIPTGVFDGFFKKISDKYPKIYYIFGNHEFYGMNYEEAKNVLNTYLSNYHITVLDNKVDMYKGVYFIGSTLWTDFNNSPIVMNEARFHISDFRVINNFDRYIDISNSKKKKMKFTPEFAKSLNEDAVRYIESALEVKPENYKTVVLTHFTPSFRSIHPKWGADPLNYYFSNDLPEALINQADVWIHGHTHDPFDYLINNTRIVCNPGGYPGEFNGFDSDKVIDV